ncbi:MAG: FHA domain-containing protein [Synechococcaceae cyanobacterium SM2_3_1]|nr:FHA domain-containing protein [Synechococcaceae cyanobacterium SM2_3_1]
MLATTQISAQRSTRTESVRSILYVNAAGTEKTFLIDQAQQTVGRGIQCEIRINHPQVSRIQAVLELHTDGRVKLIDGDGKGHPSTNGTAVNGRRVEECWLESGAEIQFGKEVMARFHQLNVGRTTARPQEPMLAPMEDVPTELSSY